MDRDTELISRFLKGDQEAFGELLAAYEKKIYSICWHFMGNRQDAEDAAQEVILKVYRKLDLFRGEASFSTWLNYVAANTCRDMLRKRKRNQTVSLDSPVETEDGEMDRELASPDDSPETDVINRDLARLVRELTRYEKLERIRLSSLDPNEFTEELLEVLYEGPPVMNHLHISLQSGDDTVLSRMRRQYDSSRFLTLTEDLYRNIPGLALTADVMVGFPGETDRQHRNSMEVIRKTGFADIHVFSYSPRQGTRAAAWPDQVQEEVREQRRQEMLGLKKKLRSRFLEAQVGKPARVLVETVRRGHASGHTENFLQAKIYGENYIKNRMVDGIIVDVREDCLILETEACHE